MSATEPVVKQPLSKMTILSTLAIVIMLVFSVVTVILIQLEAVRTHSPHTQYDETGTIMVERVYSYQFPNHIHDCIVLDPAMSLAAR